jgi:hypothetical protein
MGKDLVRVRELYAGWQTEDLTKAITVDKADYELTCPLQATEGGPICSSKQNETYFP